MKAEVKRINLRVEPEEYKRWDDMRQAQGGKFQQIGLSLFRRWYQGDREAAVPPNQDGEETDKRILTENVLNAIESAAMPLQNMLDDHYAATRAHHQVAGDTARDTEDALAGDRGNRPRVRKAKAI